MKAKAITHHHHKFLKAAYAHSHALELFNVNTFKRGEPYITFAADRELFMVWRKRDGGDRVYAAYSNLPEAIHKALSM